MTGGKKPKDIPVTGCPSGSVYTVCKSLSNGLVMDIDTDLKMSSCGGRGSDKICPDVVPRSTSVAGGVIASPLAVVSDDCPESDEERETGDQATVVID